MNIRKCAVCKRTRQVVEVDLLPVTRAQLDSEPIWNGEVKLVHSILGIVFVNAAHAGEEAKVVFIVIELEDKVLVQFCQLR